MDALTDKFWRLYELDLQEVKLAYLNWALKYLKEPDAKYRHLFVWDEYDGDGVFVCNSKYGRAFSISPFGIGVRGLPKTAIKLRRPGRGPGIDERDIALKNRLATNTGKIRSAIKEFLVNKDIEKARNAILNYQWLKLGPHELLFDRIQYKRDDTGKLRKGRWGLDESEGPHTLTGIRNRIINCVRFGEHLEDVYVLHLDKRLPGLSGNSYSTFMSSAMTWNKYAMCAFDCGPVLWSKRGFVQFKQIKKHQDKLGWPYKGTALQVLKPFYHIALDYRKPPIYLKNEQDNGYSLKSMRKRKMDLYEVIDKILDEIDKVRSNINDEGKYG